MSRKKRTKKAPKTNRFVIMTAEEATMAKKPLYNGYVVGHGVHGDTKYNRQKENRRRDIEDGLA